MNFSEINNNNDVLPEIKTTGTEGNSAKYVSSLVGGKKSRKQVKKTKKQNKKNRKTRRRTRK